MEKRIYSISELIKVGYSRDYLRRVVKIPTQKFASKTLGGGKWMINMVEFEKFEEKQRRCAR